jgi:MFS family permease
MGDRLGHSRLYLIGLVFSIPSAIGCALGNSLAAIAVFRTLGGVGAAFVLANGIPILMKTVDRDRIGRLLGLLTSMAYAGLITGSLLSGWLLSLHPGWRSVFIGSLSITLLSMVLSIWLLPPDLPRDQDGTSRPHRAAMPSNPSVAAIAMLLLAYTGLYCMTFIFPFYLLDGLGVARDTMGYILAMRPVITAVITPASGVLADRYGTRPVSLVGMFLLFLAFALPLLAGLPSSIPILLLWMGGLGAGMGVFLSPNHKFIMLNAGQARKGMASSTLSLTRNIGMLLGSAVSGAYIPRMDGHPVTEKVAVGWSAHSALFISGSIIALALVVGLVDRRIGSAKALKPA